MRQAWHDLDLLQQMPPARLPLSELRATAPRTDQVTEGTVVSIETKLADLRVKLGMIEGAVGGVITERDQYLDALDRVRRLAQAANPAMSGPPHECTNACFGGECNCGQPFRAVAWDLDPARVLAALVAQAPQDAPPVISGDDPAATPVARPLSDGDLLTVTRGDLLALWQLSRVGLQAETDDLPPAIKLLSVDWADEQQELLDRTAEKLSNPCHICSLTGGSHKMDCHGRTS